MDWKLPMAFRPLCLSSYTVEYSTHTYSFGFKEKGGVGVVVLPYFKRWLIHVVLLQDFILQRVECTVETSFTLAHLSQHAQCSPPCSRSFNP